MSTKENLQAAFAGESQANRKYLAFAKKADDEGFKQVAKLFRAAAEAETVHAHAHLRALDGVGSTKDNLAAAVAGEHHEFTAMYPGFIAEAEKEADARAVRSFKMANAVEKIHHELYTRAQQAVGQGSDLPAAEIQVCLVCGNTFSGTVPDTCPICGVTKDKFIAIR